MSTPPATFLGKIPDRRHLKNSARKRIIQRHNIFAGRKRHGGRWRAKARFWGQRLQTWAFWHELLGWIEPDESARTLGRVLGEQPGGGENGRRGRPRISAADWPLAWLPRGDRHAGNNLRDPDVGLRPAGGDPANSGVRHGARGLHQSGFRGQADGDGRPHWSRAFRVEYRLGLEPDGIWHVRRRTEGSR